jgi:hypothetical protein
MEPALPRIPEPADVADVLREQLDYLLRSSDPGDARRLHQVKELLLRVFE